MVDKLVEDDDIDLVELFKKLWDSKKTILFITVIFLILGFTYAWLAPKEYKSMASFFISTSDKSAGSLSGYASLLGMSSNSNVESLVKSVLLSESLRVAVANENRKHFTVEIQKGLADHLIKINNDRHINDFIIKKLKLRKKFSFVVNKEGLFQLTYVSNDKNLVKNILDDYLEQVIIFNENLEISAEKNVITIIDTPEIPIKKYKPKRLLIILTSAMLGGFFGIFFVLFRKFLKLTN